MLRNAAYPLPASRPLVVYAFDPTKGRKLNNFMTINVPYEALEPGPVGEKIAVIDYDASNGCYYQPVDLEDRRLLITNGLRPTESDPRFHQQMVYAVVAKTIEQFEVALGRPLWRGWRLRIFPHAFQQANAFYDRELRALLFGYFPASADDPGDNLPGQPIYTCLSHDVIVHEATHALVDVVRPHFIEATGPDAPAFHEAFADIIALFQHFAMREALTDTIKRTGGLIYRPKVRAEVEPEEQTALQRDQSRQLRGDQNGQAIIGAELTEDNPLVELARQFGEALGTRKALRAALGTKADPGELARVFEPHDRGAILVAAVFDAYFTIYVKRTRDLMRIARAGGANNPSGDISRDLADRLAGEAMKTARHFLHICIRALDYMPPVDIKFGEFLRAIITLDSELMPDDPYDYRAEIIKAFRLRGIVPDGVTSYSEDELRWRGPKQALPSCQGLNFNYWDPYPDPTTVKSKDGLSGDYATLHRYAAKNARALELSGKSPIQVFRIVPLYRTAPNGRPQVEIVVQYMQQIELPVDPARPKGETFKFRGGSTVIFNHWGAVKYVIHKSVESGERQERQRNQLQGGPPLAPREPKLQRAAMRFGALHRGM